MEDSNLSTNTNTLIVKCSEAVKALFRHIPHSEPQLMQLTIQSLWACVTQALRGKDSTQVLKSTN